MVKIYHNPRCKKSRAGLQYLEEKTTAIDIIRYLDEGISQNKLKEILTLLGKTPMEMIRTQEDMYKKEIKGKNLSDDELIRYMSANPKLIHRPIVIKGNQAVWGDPPQNIDELF